MPKIRETGTVIRSKVSKNIYKMLKDVGMVNILVLLVNFCTDVNVRMIDL